MSTDLVSWLAAQLDADEARARAATPGPWWDSPAQSAPSHHTIRGGGREPEKGRPGDVRSVAKFDRYVTNRAADIAFIVANDPAHTLRTVAAHRAILEQHYDGDSRCPTCCDDGWHPERLYAPCPTLRALASIFEDRPGFDPSWKVET